MAACQTKALIYRKPRMSETLDRLEAGEGADEAYKRPVLAVQYCSLTYRHRGAHDFRTARWIMVRSVVRVVAALIIAAAIIVVGGMDSPNLH